MLASGKISTDGHADLNASTLELWTPVAQLPQLEVPLLAGRLTVDPDTELLVAHLRTVEPLASVPLVEDMLSLYNLSASAGIELSIAAGCVSGRQLRVSRSAADEARRLTGTESVNGDDGSPDSG